MKKIYSYITIGVIALFSLSLTSCNDDEIARELDGIWEGTVSQNFSWRWTNYSNYQYVDIEFYKDPSKFSSGTGVEYDYDKWGYYTPCSFSFRVDFGVIYIDYADGARVRISEYDLTSTTFSGKFRDYDTGAYIADFSFVKVADFRHYRGYPYSLKIPFSEVTPVDTNIESK